MNASRCLPEAQRIARLPTSQWAAEVKKLPEACGNADCTNGNCQAICQDWLKMQFNVRRYLKRVRQIEQHNHDMRDKRRGR
jgi:hypothetical protein